MWHYTKPHQIQEWFYFQSADRSAGRLCLRMTRLIYLSARLCFWSSKSIAYRSCQSMSWRMRPHHKEIKKKCWCQQTQNKTRLAKITIFSKRKYLLKWHVYSPIPELGSFSQRPSSQINSKSVYQHSKSGLKPLNLSYISFMLFYSLFL